ncbi:MAG: Rho termination factor N-terminal domain-containing protein, partial [Phocaeicola sp.]
MKLKKVNLTITRKNKQSYKTTLTQATVSELKSIARSLKLKGYSRLRKADLIDFILSEIYPMLPDLTNRANTLM